jgi:hypothetical protein
MTQNRDIDIRVVQKPQFLNNFPGKTGDLPPMHPGLVAILGTGLLWGLQGNPYGPCIPGWQNVAGFYYSIFSNILFNASSAF